MLLVLLKAVSIAALSERHQAEPYLVIAPMLGRWSTVMLSNVLPYARSTERDDGRTGGAVTQFIGRTELFVATLTTLVITITLTRWPGAACWLAVIGIS